MDCFAYHSYLCWTWLALHEQGSIALSGWNTKHIFDRSALLDALSAATMDIAGTRSGRVGPAGSPWCASAPLIVP